MPLLLTHARATPRAAQNGLTAYDLASENGHVEVARLVHTDSALGAPNPFWAALRSIWAGCRTRAGAFNR
jgi:hypothetical protein